MLFKNQKILVLDTQSGKILWEGSYDNKLADILEIDGSVCLLDTLGRLLRVTVDENGINVSEQVSLGSKNLPEGQLRCEKLQAENRVILRSGYNAWLFDTEKFEIVYKIEDYAGADETGNRVYIDRFNKILTYPLYDKKEIVEKTKDLMQE